MKNILLLVAVCVVMWYCISHPSVLRSASASIGVQHVPSLPGAVSYQSMARQAAEDAGIPADLFVAQINQESGFNAAARGGSGEVGIAQFMPATAVGLGVDPSDPGASLKGAADMMGRYYREFGGDYAKALAGYNCGGGCVRGAVARAANTGVDWRVYIPKSTRAYIRAIMGGAV